MNPDQEIQNYLKARKFSEAESLIQKKIDTDPDSSDAYYLKGVSAYFQNQLGSAIECLKKSIELNPHHTDASICLSVLYNDIGKYDDARKVFDRANQSVAHHRTGEDLGIDRKFSVKHLELADLYFRYRRWDEAVEEYGKAAVLDPQNLDIRIRRAKAFAKKGFLSRALQELQGLKENHPQFIDARIQLGLLHYSQSNLLDAELEWEGVLEIRPNHAEARNYLAMVQKKRNSITQVD